MLTLSLDLRTILLIVRLANSHPLRLITVLGERAELPYVLSQPTQARPLTYNSYVLSSTSYTKSITWHIIIFVF
ncbi:hypothetical protein M430DRAFT_191201 [Amorphotheca resinae ATCC 22711]|uniref:Secreted protein n=1 Tax=Amorphotheca resinae ATCC 22711 TaxID=857342 RepID=A0A2T3APP3_AMORE|nr:hypothetical protein M430DRAFT_191201 [Amorphotheca resinae ATCC 22711]PSS06979.1 hypothetical protein M430DRAFT_191201 [Amorphotheca resinae ATCC 22711]